MTERSAPAIIAGDDDSLDDVLGRLRAAGRQGAPLDLVVPRGSSLLLTATEFRRLRDAVDRDRLGVTLCTDDPLRAQLAGLLGVASGPITDSLRQRLVRRPAAERSGTEDSPAEAVNGGDGARNVADTRSSVKIQPGGKERPQSASIDSSGPSMAPMASVNLTGGQILSNSTDGRPQATIGVPVPGVPDEAVPSELAGDGAPSAGGGGSDSWPAPLAPPAPPEAGPRRRRTRGGLLSKQQASSGKPAAPATVVLSPPARPPVETIATLAARRRRRKSPPWVGFAIGAAALLGLAIVAGLLLMPRATVAVTLERVPIETELAYDVGLPGEAADGQTIWVPATSVTMSVTVDRSVPTSGKRREPDEFATAPVAFANPNSAPVTVASGTLLRSLDGPEFALIEAVEVPSADPVSGAVGKATSEARASKPGTGGNLGVGGIGGQLENGVFYSSRLGPGHGGTDREVAVVAAADLEALDAAVEAAVTEKALSQIGNEVPKGGKPMPQTVAIETQQGTPSAAEGEAADSVSSSGTATVQVMVYDAAALNDELRTRVSEVLEAPAGRILDPTSVTFGTPELQTNSAEGARFRVPVTIDATVPFGPAERRALAERLAGADANTAEATLAQMDGLKTWRVDHLPGWLPNRMPGDPDRISIEVVR